MTPKAKWVIGLILLFGVLAAGGFFLGRLGSKPEGGAGSPRQTGAADKRDTPAKKAKRDERPRALPDSSDGMTDAPSANGRKPRSPRASAESVDEILRDLDWGNVAFNTSSTMRYTQPSPVELLLSPSASAAELQKELEERVGADSARVRVSPRMEATLTGKGFGIEALAPDIQAVASTQTTRWKWMVTPTEPGPRTLHLALSAVIDVEGHETPLVVRTFMRDIQVNITVPQRLLGFVENHVELVWTGLGVPVLAYLWSRFRKRGAKLRRRTA
jgi:hypothetical protein